MAHQYLLMIQEYGSKKQKMEASLQLNMNTMKGLLVF
ncbi:Uncharacterised protein [Yokenella regensburgei]|nr:Uncharacterised protein [Yokenella regensburgei]